MENLLFYELLELITTLSLLYLQLCISLGFGQNSNT